VRGARALTPPRRRYIRSVTAPAPETFLNLCFSLRAFLTHTEPPWVIEAREAKEAAAEAEAEAAAEAKAADAAGSDAEQGADDAASEAGSKQSAASTSSSIRSARALARYKRLMTFTGLVGVVISWTVFAWCARARPGLRRCRARARPLTCARARACPQVHLRARPSAAGLGRAARA
jgi:hypothetical protein